ncbi:MAG: peptide chain release factor N(5)-glutamine methyltransferase [Rhodobacteraceae bacterium]|nr:peptide chain release factor N(5)-glutamine methyltransferase [Paracoccaceae bacterium]
MSTGADLLAEGVARLRAAGIEGAVRDARWLLTHALGVGAERLTLLLPDPVSDTARARFDAAIDARCRHQPVAQIIGWRDFWGRRFRVTPDVLDPRPETETLIEAALQRRFERVLDLGTGTGAILLSLLAECQDAQGVGVDISPAALRVAAQNAAATGVADRVSLFRSDWFAGVAGQFDLIVSNPPYIAASELDALSPELRLWEPRQALVPQDDDGSGLAAYRHICAHAPQYLTPDGWLMVEVGTTQAGDVTALFGRSGFRNIASVADLSGRDRVVLGQSGG